MNLWICAWSSARGCLPPKVLAYEFCIAPSSPSVWEPQLCLLWRCAIWRSRELGDLRLLLLHCNLKMARMWHRDLLAEPIFCSVKKQGENLPIKSLGCHAASCAVIYPSNQLKNASSLHLHFYTCPIHLSPRKYLSCILSLRNTLNAWSNWFIYYYKITILKIFSLLKYLNK